MKSSWFPILLIATLLGLLVLLATLQYQWLGQISDAEQVRLEARLRDDTKRFAEDFNTEIQTLYFNFQIDAVDIVNKDWRAYSKRYNYWKNQTKFPELAEDFYILENGENQSPLQYLADKSAFEEIIWTGELREIKKIIDKENPTSSVIEIKETKKKVAKDTIALTKKQTILTIPIYNKDAGIEETIIQTREVNTNKLKSKSNFKHPERYGYLIILLDVNVIKKQILASLVSKYFNDNAENKYKVSINNSENKTIFQTHDGTLVSNDATAKLLSLKPNDFVFFSDRISKSSIDVQGGNKKVIFSQTKTATSNKVFEKKNDTEEVVSINIQKVTDSKPKIAVFDSNEKNNEGIWTLNVQHIDGSLEQFITNTRRKNLAISFGILSLLAISIILIFISSQRAKLLAQKQMDFVSSVSHEFRTPLAVIYSAGENLSDGVIDEREKISNYGGLIKREGKKLTGMVEQILEFAGANSGNRKFDFQEVEVIEIINEALAECQSVIEETEFVIVREYSSLLPKISADKKALVLAVQNLINNSLKYSNGSKWLKVSAKKDDGAIKITVEDKGIGISTKDKKHIFEPFYRAENVVDEQISGNGLGLSLVKQIVEAHKGSIEVESEIGNGSKFTIRLPLNI